TRFDLPGDQLLLDRRGAAGTPAPEGRRRPRTPSSGVGPSAPGPFRAPKTPRLILGVPRVFGEPPGTHQPPPVPPDSPPPADVPPPPAAPLRRSRRSSPGLISLAINFSLIGARPGRRPARPKRRLARSPSAAPARPKHRPARGPKRRARPRRRNCGVRIFA